MQLTFNDIADNVRNMSLTEKIEIKDIVEKSIIEERREEIYNNSLKASQEFRENKLKFSDKISDLRKMMDED